MSIDNEANRLAIIARLPLSAWDTDAQQACHAKSGELLKSTFVTDTQGVIVFERKYGERPGIRSVIFAADSADGTFRLVTNAFADAPKSDIVPERIARLRRTNVLETIPAHVTTGGEMLPSDALSPAMSYTFHVRSCGDNHVIASCSSLVDAKRIVAALGNCSIFQFRDSRTYDDTTVWNLGLIGAVMADA